MYVCQLCRKYATFSYASVLRHIGTVHAHEAGYNITCGIEECPSKFTNHHAFRHHLKKHPHIMVTQDPEQEELELLHVQDDSEEGSGISIATSLKTENKKAGDAIFSGPRDRGPRDRGPGE